MKKIILSLVLYIMVSSSAYSQVDRVYQRDSLKIGRTAINFTVNSRHNYNTIVLKDLVTSDSIRVYNINETGDTTPVALRDLNTYRDLASNLIRNSSGTHEYLVLHPNIYKLLITCTAEDASEGTITIRRRGNNLK